MGIAARIINAPWFPVDRYREFTRKTYRYIRFKWPSAGINYIRFRLDLLLKNCDYISDYNPIIIGGVHRSGTTLIRSLIGSHPDIAAVMSEFTVFPSRHDEQLTYRLLDFDEQDIAAVNGYTNPVEFTERVLKRYAEKHNKPYAATKSPRHILFVDRILQYFPNAIIVHCIRDGRDVANSLRYIPKHKMVDGKIIPLNTNNPYDGCVRIWKTEVEEGLKWRHLPNYHEIKYEDVVLRPLETLNTFFTKFRFKEVGGEILEEFYKREKPEKHLQTIEVGQPLYQNAVGKWKKTMTGEEKEIFKNIAGDLLIKLGYEKDYDW